MESAQRDKVLELIPGADARIRECIAMIRTLARFKFEHYDSAPPATTFTDALVGWLAQAAPEDRAELVHFLADELVFVSRAEQRQLIRVFAEDFLCALPVEPQDIGVCALSDGVHMGELRRAAHGISQRHFWPDARLIDEQVRHLVFVDDFSGTGRSLLFRTSDDRLEGRLERAREWLSRHQAPELQVTVVLLGASGAAARYLAPLLEATPFRWGFTVLQLFSATRSTRMRALSAQYTGYPADPRDKTPTNVGYRSGDLPVVLSHNTPNDSLAILWDGTGAVFPRVDRFRYHQDRGRP
jgi:hypothetical protein